MKKSKFIRSTIILIIGGFITKLLGMIIKIITTNLIGTEGIGINMIILPTYMLLILILLFSSNFISEFLIRERRTYLGLISIGFFLPFISISSIMRGYFFGKEKTYQKNNLKSRKFPTFIYSILAISSNFSL